MASTPERDRLHFVYVDLPERLRTWKRGDRGIHLYYLLWLFASFQRARRMEQEVRFDLVWHATFANAWMGTTAALVRAPFVYGPVGGGVTVPLSLVPALGLRGALSESLRSSVRGASRYLNPLARLAWNRADLILVQNPETRDWLPRRHRHKAQVFPNIVLNPVTASEQKSRSSNQTALFAGRLVPWKGAALAVRALAKLPGWRLLIAGQGPDEVRVHALAARLGMTDRVHFLGQVARPRLEELMRREAAVLLFPSMREEAGWVVGEAMVSGLPVVCLDRGGPAVLGGSSVGSAGVRRTTSDLAQRVLMVAGTGASPGMDVGFDARRSELRLMLLDGGLLRQEGLVG